MKKSSFYILLLVVVSAASLSYYVPKYGLIYDGGLYAGLGFSLQDSGSYVFNGMPGDVPPAYPFFLGAFISLFGEKGIFLVTPLLSILLVVVVFLIFREDFDEDLAFLGALLILFNPPIFFYMVQVVRDTPLLTFVMLSYYLYYKAGKDNRLQVFLGFTMALAFLTKYSAAIYLAPILLHAFFRKRPVKTALLWTALLVLPWVIWSQRVYGTLLVSHSTYLASSFGVGIGRFFNFIFPLFVDWAFAPLFLLSIPGVYLKLKKEPLNPLAILYLLTIAVGVFWPEKDIRYVFIAFIPLTYFSIVFLGRYRKELAVAILVISLAFQVHTSYRLVNANTYQNLLFSDAGHWLRENTSEDTRILAHSYRQINYYSHRLTYQPPSESDKLERYIQFYNTSYAVVDTYEKYTPSYMYGAMKKYSLVKVFKDHGKEVRIYDLRRPPKLTVLLSFDFESQRGANSMPAILDTLSDHQANATFFVTGAMAKGFPAVVKGIKSRGFEIGSHGFNHEFPIFEEEDAEMFARLFNKSFDYEWGRSARTLENYERALQESREAIKNATGRYPRSYRSPILTPSYTGDMRYLDVVERLGFTIDSSISRRYMVEGMIDPVRNVTEVPASLSDSELGDEGYVLAVAREHAVAGHPLVVFFHPWRVSDRGVDKGLESFLNLMEETFTDVEYDSLEGYVDRAGAMQSE